MVDTFVGEKQEDFIAQLLRLINAGHGEEATEKILEMDALQNQLAILEQLAAQLDNTGLKLRFELALLSSSYRATRHAHDLDLDLNLARIPALELAHYIDSDLARSLDLALELDLARDLTSALTHALDLDPEAYGARARARDLTRTLDSAFDLARNLDIVRAVELLQTLVQINVFLISIYYIPQNLQKQINAAYQQTSAKVYEESLYQQRENPSPLIDVIVDVLQALFGDDIRYITLEGVDHITPDIVAYDIAPYLQSLGNIQRIYCELNDKPFTEPRIIQIHNESPKIELVDMGETIRALNDVVTPRKRKQDAEMRDLQAENLRLQNEKQKLENQRSAAENQTHLRQIELEQNNRLEQEEKSIQIAKAREELKQMQAETRQKELALEEQRWQIEKQQMRFYFDLAKELLAELAPDGLSPEQMLKYLPETAHSIKIMWENRLTMRIGYHDTPRPPTLPEEK